jgi:2-dehydro-3-deoxygluconokinase
MSKIVTFGELMLRLSPPHHEMFLQTPGFVATFGGAEAHAAVSLANYGEAVAFVTALPPNPIGDAAIRELRGFGVNTSFIRRSGERMGIYYTQTGACARPSVVLYDRNHSAIAESMPGEFDWDVILEGTEWFHVTGITPAISEGTALATLEALEACRRKNITVSCDLNYRKKLWKWGKKPLEVMPEIVRFVSVLSATRRTARRLWASRSTWTSRRANSRRRVTESSRRRCSRPIRTSVSSPSPSGRASARTATTGRAFSPTGTISS